MKDVKRIITALVLIVVSVIGLTACGKSAGSGDTNTSEADTTTAPVKEETEDAMASKENGELKEINIGYPTSGSDWADGVLGEADAYGFLEEYLNPLGYTAKLSGFVGAAPAIHEALVSKDLDYVVYAGMAGVLGKANGIDTELLAITKFTSGWRLVASADSEITSIEDLKGKKVAYMRGASPQMYLLKVLKEGGLAFEDIEGVNMTIPDGLSGVATGSVDAAVVSAGQEDSLVKEGKAKVIHIGFEADKDTYYEPSVLIGRTAAVEENQEVAVAITKALLKAKDKIAEDTNAYYQLASDKSGIPMEIILATAEENVDIAFPLNLDQTYVDSLSEIQDFLTSNELISGEVDFDQWVDKAVIDKAVEEYNSEK